MGTLGLRALGRALAAAALALLAFTGPAPAQERLRVLTTLPDLWSITRALVGDLGEVQVATRPGQNPHDLEIRPSQIGRGHTASAIPGHTAHRIVMQMPRQKRLYPND